MTPTPGPASPQLAEFLRRCYWPTFHQRSSAGERRRELDAVAMFSQAVGRPAAAADLTADNYAAFRELLTAKKLRTRRHMAYRDALGRLWEFAWRRGYAAIAPLDDPPRRHIERGPVELSRLAEWRSGKGITMPPAEPGTLQHFYETVYKPQCLLQSPQSTLESFRALLIAIYRINGRNVTVGELTDSLAADLFAAMLKAGLTAWSVNRHRAHLFALWRDAATRGLVTATPSVRKLRVTRNAPDAWSVAELDALLAAAASHRPGRTIHGVPYGLLMPAMLVVIFYTALRRRTVCEIRRADVDLAAGRLTVLGKSMKTRRGKRFLLPPVAVDALRKIWDPPRELLFPITPRHFTGQFRRILRESGLAPSVHRAGHAHKVRRSAATHATIAGGLREACELLGHTTEYVTKLYIDPTMMPDQQTGLRLPTVTVVEQPVGNAPEQPFGRNVS